MFASYNELARTSPDSSKVLLTVFVDKHRLDRAMTPLYLIQTSES